MKISKISSIVVFLFQAITILSLTFLRTEIHVFALTFNDTVQADFNLGSYGTNTSYNTTDNQVELNTAGKTARNGSYFSQIKNAGAISQFTNLSWIPSSPIGKQLPNNGVSETVYATDNFNMSNNKFLFHFNEASGNTIFNYSPSGSAFNGVCSTTTCPTFGASFSKFGNSFNAQTTAPATTGGFTLPIAATIKGQSQISISAWIRSTSSGITKVIFEESRPGSASTDRFSFRINTANRLQLSYRPDSGAQTVLINPTTTLAINTWYHVVAVFDSVSDNHKIYINGVQNQNTAVIDPIPNTDPTNGPAIGSQASNTQIFTGQMEEFALFTGRVLTQAEVTALYKRGATKLQLQVRSCNDPACSGENFIGPNGTPSTYYTDIFVGNNTLPTVNLTNVSNNQYFQYHARFDTEDSNPVAADRLTAGLRSVSTVYNLIPLFLSFSIRNEDDSSSDNSCELGTVSLSTYKSCGYRLEISTTSPNGYYVYIQSENLNNGLDTISNANPGSGGSGGSLINNSTAGTEKTGCLFTPGLLTSGSSITTSSVFNAGANSVACNSTTPTILFTANGANFPGVEDNINTPLIEHRINASATTPSGVFSQVVTYTVVPRF